MQAAACLLLALWSLEAIAAEAAQPAAKVELPPGHADVDAEARAAFAAALKHLDNRQWQAAADGFSRTLVLRASPEVRFNLATALSELGRSRDALEQLDTILAEPKARKPVRQSAELMRQRILPQLAHVAIDAPADEVVSVSVDGIMMDAATWPSGVPVDAGAHDVAVARASGPPFHKHISVKPGETVRIALIAPVQPPPPDLTLAMHAQPASAAPSPTPSRYGWLWWTAGAALASLVVIAAHHGSGVNTVEGNAGHFEIGAR